MSQCRVAPFPSFYHKSSSYYNLKKLQVSPRTGDIRIQCCNSNDRKPIARSSSRHPLASDVITINSASGIICKTSHYLLSIWPQKVLDTTKRRRLHANRRTRFGPEIIFCLQTMNLLHTLIPRDITHEPILIVIQAITNQSTARG